MKETYQQKNERLEPCKCEGISKTYFFIKGVRICTECGGEIE